MTNTKLKVSGEVDSYCTKCKLDLAHRIIAMVGDQPKKVECRTCGSHHVYRRPKSLGAPEKAPRAASTAPRGTGGKTASARAVAAAEAENKRERTWEKTVSGKGVSDFKLYRTTQTFGEGDLLRHAKFGDGYVLRVVDKIKIGVMFKDGEKTLAHAMEGLSAASARSCARRRARRRRLRLFRSAAGAEGAGAAGKRRGCRRWLVAVACVSRACGPRAGRRHRRVLRARAVPPPTVRS